MDSPGPPRVAFGPFEFEVSTGELYRDGQRIRLQEQPRQVLAALLDRPGEIATRDELRDRLWKSDTFVDFEHGLNTAIKKVRQALGDSADQPQFIETLARRGYRFIAPVTACDVLSEPTEAPPSPPPHGAENLPSGVGWSGRLSRWSLAGLVLLVAVGIVWTLGRFPVATRQPAALPRAAAHLAVMPLQVLDAPEGTDLSYLGIGVADAITTRLANIRQIAMRPTSAVLPYKDRQIDPVRASAALGVQYILMGTIQPADGLYRVRVQLVGADGLVVWGRTYDEPRAGLLQLQDRLAEQVVTALRIELLPPERARLHVRYTENPAAYDLYLRGRVLLVNYTESNMRQAIAYFEQAVALDHEYALARAAIATAAAWFSVRYAYESQAIVWGRRAEDEARRALEQDPVLADAHLALASAAGTLYGGFDWATVLERTATALSLDPSLDLARILRMRAFSHLGLFEDAREEARLAHALNPAPNTETARLVTSLHLFTGNYELAAAGARDLLRQTDAPAVPQYLGLARHYMGHSQEARDILGAITRGGEPDIRSQASLASVEAATKHVHEARTRADRIARGAYMDHHVAYSLAAAFAQLGDLDTSMAWLRKAATTGFPCYPCFERDPLLTPLREDNRFVRLITDLRAKQQAIGGRVAATATRFD